MAFSDNVTTLKKDNKTYHIIGTAHISKESVEEVKAVIDEIKPDTVCVELCETRYNTINNPDRWKSLDIFAIIREKKVLYLLSNIAVGAFQRRIGAELGVKPGAEFVAAIEKAKDVGAELVLADRDVQATLKRTWRNLSFFKKMNTLSAITESLFESDEKVSAEDIEKMKEKNQLEEAMKEFADENPEIQKPLIDERDQFLMSAIEEAKGETIVAVVGAGHVAGMQTYFGKSIDREKLSQIPPPKAWTGLIKWIIPLLVMYAFYKGYTDMSGQTFQAMLERWILPNAIVSALFTIVARGHILSVIVAFIASPITSLIPLIGTGFFVGYVEAKLRKPTVADCERIPDEAKDIKGFYSNRFTHVLIVFFLSNLGSSLGAVIGTGLVAWLLAM